MEAVQLIDAAVQTVDDGTTLEEAAVKTVTTTKEVAVQVAPSQQPVQPPRHVPVVSAGWSPHLPHVQAVSAGHPQLHQAPAVSAACPHLNCVPAANAAFHLHHARHLPQEGVQILRNLNTKLLAFPS